MFNVLREPVLLKPRRDPVFSLGPGIHNPAETTSTSPPAVESYRAVINIFRKLRRRRSFRKVFRFYFMHDRAACFNQSMATRVRGCRRGARIDEPRIAGRSARYRGPGSSEYWTKVQYRNIRQSSKLPHG